MNARMVCLLAAAVASLAVWMTPAGAASVVQDAVVVASEHETANGPSCEGTAPMEPGCVDSFVLTGNFNIDIGFSAPYRGTLNIRVGTETGSTTVICWWVFPYVAPDCDVERAGVFIEGQEASFVVLATGQGPYRVSIS